jgi:nucleoredoxin
MASLSDLLGAKLTSKAGDVDTSSLDADYVGVYFSAHWCPPCRQFTPMLAEFYNTHKVAKKLEIVFASSDKDKASFDDYYNEMPWLALPFEDRALKDKLSKKFKVGGIPTLVILDKSGAVVTTKARGDVMSDKGAANFPWRPKSFADILGENTLVLKDGSKVKASDHVAGKTHIGLYFSAHWCPPCRAFTPTLAAFYDDADRAPGLEILFVSADKDQGQFNDYHGEQPWPAFEFGSSAKDDLMGAFEVEGFPTFLILDANTGKVLIEDGRARVEAAPKDFPWPPKAVENLGVGMGAINDGKLALLLSDMGGGTPENEAILTNATKVFGEVAGQVFAAQGGAGGGGEGKAAEGECADGNAGDDDEEDGIKFTVAVAGDDMVGRVRQFFGLSDDAAGSVRVLVTDIPNRIKYMAPAGIIQDAVALKAFLDEVKAGTAKSIGISDKPAAE